MRVRAFVSCVFLVDIYSKRMYGFLGKAVMGSRGYYVIVIASDNGVGIKVYL